MSQSMNDLMEMARKINGRAKSRTIGENEASEILELVANLQADESVKTIRVYSWAGFVPNSYKHRAEIRYFEARRVDGKLVISAHMTSAQRSGASGSLVTVNGRAYSG